MKLSTVAAVTIGRMEDDVVWHVQLVVDSDGHLNIYIESGDGTEIEEVETTQGDGWSIALRFTTRGLEAQYLSSEDHIR